MLFRSQKCIFRRHKKYFSTEFLIGQKRIVLMKPTTYMNLSGLAVSSGIKKYKTVLSNLLILSDDINLPLGKIRIRPKGSAGGHNGLQSIIEQFKSELFPRLRIGIRPEEKITDMVDFVLSPFNEREKEALNTIIEITGQVVLEFIHEGVETAMNKFN